MPTYSYKCTACDTAFDIQQSFTDESLTECPECAGRLRKLYSAVGVSFTGSGFYRNDSRAATPSSGAKSSGGKPDSAGSKDSAGAAKEKVSSSSASGSAGSSSTGSTAAAS